MIWGSDRIASCYDVLASLPLEQRTRALITFNEPNYAYGWQPGRPVPTNVMDPQTAARLFQQVCRAAMLAWCLLVTGCNQNVSAEKGAWL